ncbi:MAG: tRNA dihydrouridine synthase DusB [Candidatus Eisenbacteria bacterium]|nr:tRNA dihydrouridine synthase DusB [Candidatus Eisenbacteria bacterium]
MKIGGLDLEAGALLAPLCGITTPSFRVLCRRFGAAAVYSETLSSDALFRLNRKTIDMARFHPEERPYGVQIFGDDPERFALSARILEDMIAPDLIDLNFGCPAPKFVRNGRGAALLKDPERIGRIVRAVARAVRTPVTAKIRTGWDGQSIRAAEIARICEDAGASAITVHGRTARQGYRGEADWDRVAEVVRAVRVPVIGNGDISDGDGAARRIEETGCAAVMIGRASIGNPFVFRSARTRLEEGRDAYPPGPEELLRTCREHLRLIVEDRGTRIGVREFRRHLARYVRGLPGSAAFRNRVNRIEEREEVERALEDFFAPLIEGGIDGP